MERSALRLAAAAAASLLAALGSGCRGVPEPTRPLAPVRPPSVDGGPLFESPARFALFPEVVEPATFSAPLPDGSCLVLTEDGLRWRVVAEKGGCSGRGAASGSTSVEPLVFFRQNAQGEFEFFTEGGTMLSSRSPLGAFEKTVLPATPLRAVAGSSKSVVGIDRRGRPMWFDGSWQAAEFPESGRRAIDVAVDEAGQAALLLSPEALATSQDGGKKFELISAKELPIGAWELGRAKSGHVLVRGVLRSLELEPGRSLRVLPKDAEFAAAQIEITPERGPTADALNEGRAAMSGRRYAEVFEVAGETRYELWQGELGAPLERTALAGFGDCEALTLSLTADKLAFACTRTNDEGQVVVQISVSSDQAKNFLPLANLRAATLLDVRMRLARDGSVLLTGACVAEAADDDPEPAPADQARDRKPKPEKPRPSARLGRRADASCTPRGPILLRPPAADPKVASSGLAAEVIEGQAARLELGSARSPMLSLDGRVAYFLGREKSTSVPGVFVSKDGGRGYAFSALSAPNPMWEGAEEDDIRADVGFVTLPDDAQLQMDETGTLGLVAEDSQGYFYATFDAEARLRTTARTPEPASAIGGAGSRLLAFGYGRGDGVLLAWESLDGGVSFSPLVVTEGARRSIERGVNTTVCALGGCVIGRELVRVGWEGQVEVQLQSFAPPTPPLETQLSAPLSCQLIAQAPWTRIEGPPSQGLELPTLRATARGKSAWSLLRPSASGELAVVEAPIVDRPGSAAPKLVTRGLLAARTQGPGERLATLTRSQSEGFVTLRARVPLTKQGAVDRSRKLDGLELAFVNHYNGLLERRSVQLPLNWSPELLSGDSLRPDLLTIAGPGVALHMGPEPKASFLGPKGRTTLFDLPSWPSLIADHGGLEFSDAAFVNDNVFSVAFFQRMYHGFGFMAAPPSPSAIGFAPTAMTLGGAFGESEWMQFGDRVGVMAIGLEPEGDTYAQGFLLEADGSLSPPIALPGLADLQGKLTPCSAEQRQKSPRTVAAHFTRRGVLATTAGRRPILVSDPSPPGSGPATSSAMEPMWLLSSGAVLHGTPAEPCVAGVHAASLRPGAVLVLAGQMQQGWLIRELPGPPAPVRRGQPPRPTNALEARPVTCKLQSDLAVPLEVQIQSGRRLGQDQP